MSHRAIWAAALGFSLVPMLFLACKSGGDARVPARPGSDGGGEASAATFATSPPPSGLPPMAAMPPPGVLGSKKAKRRLDAALAACGGQSTPRGKDPATLVKQLGDACSAASKMKPVGPLLRGQQADKEAHQENRFHAEANHCYRVYFATEDAVKDAVLILRDSAGDMVAESPGPSAPEDGAACFTTSDDVTLLLGVGSGKGTWAAQVWSD